MLSSVDLAVIGISLPSFPRRRESREPTSATAQSPLPGFRVALRLPGMTGALFIEDKTLNDGARNWTDEA